MDAQFAGYHKFHEPTEAWSGSPDPRDPANFWIDDETEKRVKAPNGFGSFEVFQASATSDDWNADWYAGPGWYWWACFPGCLPDGEASGPFETAEAAYLDALG